MTGSSIFLKGGTPASEPSAVDKFLAAVGSSGGRLIFALDATASRSQTWDLARGLTGDMIREAAAVGRLQLQLVYFRGGAEGPKECSTSGWTSDAGRLAQLMAKVECRAGYTQISRVLEHARKEAQKATIGALVFIGDACEHGAVDNLDRLYAAAAELGMLKVPVFAFQENTDPDVEKTFRKIASLSNGVYGRFDAGGVRQLGDLLKAVAAFAAGGTQASWPARIKPACSCSSR
jgi:hypothetical protein